jgi:eukaryotic-like serine/threonine-protein kinase
MALDHPAGEARESFLRAACGDDEHLLAEIHSLLKAHAEAAGFLRTIPPDVEHRQEEGDPTQFSTGREYPSQMIGRYKLLQMIGEGGFGSVWMAEQKEPVKRRVALKIIKLGMDTRQVVARFEAERQALAMMDHPNIARVLDAGATELGRPFFVMELVKGEPLTAYCDRHNYSILQRLDLFVQVCKAVQHAHQKGIIHRDLKPGNVLVATQDGAPHAKVIDFGIAKAISRQLTEKTLFTEHRQLIGTPEYMSPEQAEGSLDIDTRTDVYSLGVLLYELLTGSTPFDNTSLRAAAYAEIQRIIREVEPPRPSTRLSQSQDTLASIAARRHIEPRRLGTIIRGELDWIVMKCLEKDRQRRYETADSLALDIQRYLAGEAVTAAPPSRLYKIRKVVRKNKGPFAAAAIIALALVLGVVGTSWGMVSAVRQREIAEQARRDEAQQRLLAQESEHRAVEAAALAEREAQRAEAEAALALAAQAREQARAQELEQVAEFQASQLRDIQTELMGGRLRNDILSKRQAHLESRGDDEEAIAAAMAALRESLTGVNFTNVALQTLDENIFERALAAIEEKFGDQLLIRARLLQTVAETLATLGLLQRATAPQVEALEIRRGVLGNEHPDTLLSLSFKGSLLRHQGKIAEAEPYLREALQTRRRVLGDEHPDTLTSINQMGLLLREQGKLVEAEPYFREALEGRRRILGDEHSETHESLNNMGFVLHPQGRLAEAEPYFREALEGYRRVLGDDHPSTLFSLNNMGALLHRQGKLAEAEPYLREALQARRRVLGDEHPETLNSMNNMGALLHIQGKLAEAEPYYREALEGQRRLLGEEHPATLSSMNNMGALLSRLGRFAEAELYHRQALEARRRILGDEHSDTLQSMNHLRSVLRAQGRLTEAEPYVRHVLEVRRRTVGDEHPDTVDSMSSLASVLGDQGKLAEAEPYLRRLLEIRRPSLGEKHADAAAEIAALALCLLQQNTPEKALEAEPLLRELLDIRTTTLAPDHWNLANTRSLLGGALLIQGRALLPADPAAAMARLAEARPLLEEGYQRMNPPPEVAFRKAEALQRIIELFEMLHAAEPEQGHDAEAEAWRARQAPIEAPRASESRP